MAKKNKKPARTEKRIGVEEIFFFLCAVLSIILTFFATEHCIDSDASSELVLSNHLAENGGILTADWGYSTELRVINTQLVYAPLFKIFKDWHMVRFFGALILQAILVGSFYVFTKATGISKKVFFISAGLFLLPVSVCYGRIVLYNGYYVPHIAISMVIAGLVFAKNEGRSGRWIAVRTLCLLILSFLGGLGGIRQGMMTHAPLLLAVFVYYVMDDLVCKRKEGEHTRKRLGYLLNAIGSAVVFVFGYLVNTGILAHKYEFSDYSENMVGLIEVAQFKDIAYGLMHHFGFRDEIKLMSVLGVLSVLGVVLTIACIIVAVVQIVKYKEHKDVSKALPSVMFLSFLAVMLLVFIVLGKYYYFVLYFTPVVAWYIPVFAQTLCERPKDVKGLNMRRVLPMVAAVIIFLNGAVNGIYFLDHTKFEQKYEGLVFKDREITQTLEPVVEFLVENGYERGYAHFWNANIITEMSDGAVRFVNVHVDNLANISFNPWLCLKTNRTLQGTKDFLLLEAGQRTSFESKNNLSRVSLVYQDENYVIYAIQR
ncbi:MAG: hypothetical protein IJ388_02795 [Oscillospiraceae bacterium]|nr:hypothetical protein [Oscillospiraceae bacterium]